MLKSTKSPSRKMTNCVKVSTNVGRLMFLLLMIAQCLLFASFPAKYRDNSAWYTFLLFITPSLGFSWWWVTSKEKKIIHPLCIWFSYTWLGLVPMIGIVFGLTAEKLDRSQQFSPNVLKISLGITPLLLLLLLYTAAVPLRPPRRRNMLINLSFFIVIDIFDSNDLLRMVIDENVAENTQSFGIPRSLVTALLSFACIAFLLSPLEMVLKLLTEVIEDADEIFKRRKCVNGVVLVIQVCLNVTVLGLRLSVLGYGLDASLFIAKNVVMIFARSLECRQWVCVRRDEEVERAAEEALRRNEPPIPTAPPL